MSFSGEFRQSHFQIYELVLPYCSVCTPKKGITGTWHTPVTCEEIGDSEYSLFFASQNLPLSISPPTRSIDGKSVLNSSIFRCITSATESTAQLKGGKGLASRGTMSISCADFAGDCGPVNFTDKGTFFGKLRARNVLQGKKIITHYYSIVGGQGEEMIEKVGQSVHFVTSNELSGGKFKLSARDALKDAEELGEKFPAPSVIELVRDLDLVATTFEVSRVDRLSVGGVIRVGAELMRINAIDGTSITVAPRGSSMSNASGESVYSTAVEEHKAGDSVQQCYTMSKTPLHQVLVDIFTAAKLTSFIDAQAWQNEIAEWSANAELSGVFSKPQAVDKLLNQIFSAYMIDAWLDQDSQKIKLSAVSAWKDAIKTLSQDDYNNLSINDDDNNRFSRAFMYCAKPLQAESDDVIYYKKLVSATDSIQERDDLYGEIKEQDLGMIPFISSSSAQVTVSRFVQRFSKTPKKLSFKMEERKLAGIKLGDIVDVISLDSQTPSGETLQARERAQITRIQPNFNGIGRTYSIDALSYVPQIATNPDQELVITLRGTLYDVDLFARAGAPNSAVKVTFIMDACTIGSTSVNAPAVRAGAFESGSRIRIIAINGTKWSAKGGDSARVVSGGRPYNFTYTNPEKGGDCYQSDGVTTEIYLNYVVDNWQASSEMIAAGAGSNCGVGYAEAISGPSSESGWAVALAGGGNGIPAGAGGYWSGVNFYFAGSIDAPAMQAATGSFKACGAALVSKSAPTYLQSATATASLIGTQTPSGNSIAATATASVQGSDINWSESITQKTGNRTAQALAGGAIKGAGVKVYNNNASKFVAGRSDSFELIG